MSGFTPGPWVATNPSNVIRRQFRDGKGRRVTHWIAECLHQAGRGVLEDDANARLIAAAPELYEALRSLRAALSSGVEVTQKVLPQVDAALAKARGEQV